MSAQPNIESGLNKSGQPKLVAVIDSGGTKCVVTLASKEGIVARTTSGPCN